MSKEEINFHVKNASSELKAAGECAIADAREAAEQTRAHLRIVARQTSDKVQEFMKHQKEHAHLARERAEDKIKENPWGSTAAAFGVGMLLGSLFSSRRS